MLYMIAGIVIKYRGFVHAFVSRVMCCGTSAKSVMQLGVQVVHVKPKIIIIFSSGPSNTIASNKTI